MKKYADLYLDARKALMAQEDAQYASLLARNLLCHVSGKSQEAILTDRELYASDEIEKALDDEVNRVLAGEPLAYVLGEWDFYGMRLYVDKNVLIPRDDTCAVTAAAIKKALFLDSDPRILDLCTGSGCIGLAIANRVKDARVTLADISREALNVAKKNIALQKLSSRVSCVQQDALDLPAGFLGKFDLIVSNPPYVTTEEMEKLPVSVRDFEPHLALHGGADGLKFYRAIAKNFARALKPGGYLCFEFGMGQAEKVCTILEENGYTVLDIAKDYQEIQRAVVARYGRKEV